MSFKAKAKGVEPPATLGASSEEESSEEEENTKQTNGPKQDFLGDMCTQTENILYAC